MAAGGKDELEVLLQSRFLILVLGLCAALSVACGSTPEVVSIPTATITVPTPSPQPEDTPTPPVSRRSNRDRHFEPSGGFSYVPPESWEVTDSLELEYKTLIGPAKDEFAANMTVLDEPFGGTLEEYVPASLDNMSQYFQGFQLLSQDEFEPEESPGGRRLVTENLQYGRALRQTFYLFDLGAKKLVIVCTRLSSQAEELDSVCEDVVRTLRLESE
jgi:hypothetical protein